MLRVIKMMRRAAPVLFLGAVFLTVSYPAFASSDDWGQKISDEFHKVLSRVRKNNLRPIHVRFSPIVHAKKFIPPELSKETLRKLSRNGQARLGALGYVYPGSLTAAINRTEAMYQAANNIRQSQDYQNLSAQALEPLNTRWDALVQTHDQLSAQAPDLDSENEALASQAQELNSEKTNIENRKSALRGAIDSYNESCAGKTLPQGPYEERESERQNLDSQITQLQSDISQHNSKVNDFNSRVDNLKTSASNWIGTLESWVNDMDSWVEEVKAALAQADAGECTDDLKNSVHEICDANRKCRGDQSCDELRDNLQKNLDCYNVRKKVMDVCPGNSGKDHQGQLAEVQNAIDTCRGWIAKTCDVSITTFSRKSSDGQR